MYRAEKRRARDRKFIPYRPDVHFIRAFALSARASTTWDLFPPTNGYRPFSANSEKTYTVSLQRQHADWSKLVIARDQNRCQRCGAIGHLEAHHIWPQGGYENLRYLLRNGVALCKPCHEHAYHATEVTPGQFFELALEASLINANIESEPFWSYYTAGLEKGRVLAYGLLTAEEMCMKEDEMNFFLCWAKLNNFVARSKAVAADAPFADQKFRIIPEVERAIEAFSVYR